MKKCIKYKSIDQFRTIVTNINRQVSFVGLDENGDAIYDPSIPKPKLTFRGTVKVHGTNFGVSYNNLDGLWFQSRENIITSENDNAGAAFAGETNREIWLKLINQLATRHDINLNEKTITIYAEWAGKSIQKNVGVTNIDKSAFIFSYAKVRPIEIKPEETSEIGIWVKSNDLRSPEHRIYNIEDYGIYEIEVDFNVPQLSQNKIVELTIEVEKECPVAKAFGFANTIGEGIVFTTEYKGNVFYMKSKGELHAGKSKVKTLSTVDDEKIRKRLDIAEQVTPTWRLQQMLEQACDFMNGGTLDRSKLGNYIRLVISDIVKEESDVLAEAGLEPSDITRYVSEIARKYFFDQELV